MKPTTPITADILVVDDAPDNLRLLVSMLGDRGYQVRPVTGGEAALRAIRARSPDLILLDVNMPGMDGYETCGRLKSAAATRDIPVIFLSAIEDTAAKIAAFRAGGVDYVTKPFHPDEVLARVGMHLELSRGRLALARSLRDLEELERARDAFIHMVAHDMRTPLAGVDALLAGCQASLAERDKIVRPAIAEAQAGVAEILVMVGQMLDLSRLRHGKLPLDWTELDLRALVLEVVAAARLAAGRRRVTVATQPSITVPADRGLIRRVCENLLGNALKFTAEDGRVEIGIRVEGDAVVVEFADDGIGIRAAEQDRIFEPFAQSPTTGAGRGFGIGLAFVQTAVAAHGGTVGVRSGVGSGSIFSFTLPRSPASARPPEAGTPPGT